jgi:hypothetical protein
MGHFLEHQDDIQILGRPETQAGFRKKQVARGATDQDKSIGMPPEMA